MHLNDVTLWDVDVLPGRKRAGYTHCEMVKSLAYTIPGAFSQA
jgi:hypothetical protein